MPELTETAVGRHIERTRPMAMEETKMKQNDIMPNVKYASLLKKEDAESSPLPQHSLCSLFIFGWLSPLVKLGNQQPLEQEDLVTYPGQHQTKDLTERIETIWNSEVKTSQSPRLWLVVLRFLPKLDVVFLMLMQFLFIIFRYTKPLLLYMLLTELGHKTYSYMVYFYVSGMSIALAMESFAKIHYMRKGIVMAAHVRNALTGLIYNEVFKKTEQKIAEITSGHVINLITKDMEPFAGVANRAMLAAFAPLEIVLAVFLLLYLIGSPTMTFVIVILAALILQVIAARVYKKLRQKIAAFTDLRLQGITDVLTGIRVIKMNVWEACLDKKVEERRRNEISATRKQTAFQGFTMACSVIFPPLATFVALVSMVISGYQVTSREVFTTLLLMSYIGLAAVDNFVDCVYACSQAIVSLKRIERFLTKEDQHHETEDSSSTPKVKANVLTTLQKQIEEPSFTVIQKRGYNNVCVQIQTPAFLCLKSVYCYSSNVQTLLLENVNLTTYDKQFVTLTGPVGSGKTSIFNAIISEFPDIKGEIQVQGKVAYVPQNPWVFSGSVRDNILFGDKFDEERYLKIIESCALKEDFKLLENGDLTLIGERGVSLSGGQRSRVSLARAVYSDADIYLLDDPLRALDANVSAHVFENCICGLLKNRLRIMVTHSVEHLAKSDRVVVMKDGRTVSVGSYEELLQSNDYVSYLASLLKQKRNAADEKQTEEKRIRLMIEFQQHHRNTNSGSGINTATEDRDTGHVTSATYWKFMRTGASIFCLLLITCLFLLAEGFMVSSNIWLSRWSKMKYENQRHPITLAIYGSLLSAALILGFLRTLIFSLILLKVSEKLHNKMLRAVIKARVRFFDTNPVGRILNRFAKDIGYMDNNLPYDFCNFIQLLLANVAALTLVSGTVIYISAAALPVFLLFSYVARRGIKACREMKRLESIASGPLCSHFFDTIEGLVTIRCHNRKKHFIDTAHKFTDNNATALLAFLGCTRWITLRLELLAFAFTTAMMFTAILMKLDDALAGLAIFYSISLCTKLYDTTYRAMSVEFWMTSVQRVMTYAELESEPGYQFTKESPAKWPNNGSLQFKQLSLRYYSQGPKVLDDLCFTINMGEKVGIVGRTGAGKSSLIAAVMRMPEHEGDLLIDGVTIKELNLTKSRAAVSVITQNSFLFNDTLRFNLDPEEKHTDYELWNVLEKMQLKPLVEKMPDQLYCLVHENGSNYSVGERQMICLARAMLQRNKILIFDEATASIDLQTEKLIHEVVHSKFKDCTVITIAHRLNTITDHDRVLVLNEGKVVEYDSPHVLLNLSDGYLAELYKSY